MRQYRLHAQLLLTGNMLSSGSKESFGYLFPNTPCRLCEKLRPEKSKPTFPASSHLHLRFSLIYDFKYLETKNVGLRAFWLWFPKNSEAGLGIHHN